MKYESFILHPLEADLNSHQFLVGASDPKEVHSLEFILHPSHFRLFGQKSEVR